MNIVNCLVVDDEPHAIRLLEKYIAMVPFLELKNSTSNPLEVIRYVESEKIDLVFLDIEMPNLSGIQIGKILSNRTKFIFTTAYSNFAVESYRLNALDYLLKPIEFERFYESIEKFNSVSALPVDVTNSDNFIFIKTDGKNNFEKVFFNDIIYIEGLKNYVIIYTESKKIITYSSLKNIDSQLSHSNFVQIHKSFIVSISHIKKTDSYSVFLQSTSLPIGATFKSSFFEKLNEYRL
jgi:DNA-binding LytR/AlgR family response regulator